VKEEVSSEIDLLVLSQSSSIPLNHTASDTACSPKKQPHRRPRSDSSATRERGSPRLDTPSGSSTSAHPTSISNNTPQLEDTVTGNLDLIPVELMPYFKELAAERIKLVGRSKCVLGIRCSSLNLQIATGLARTKPWPPEGFEEQLSISDWEQIRRDTMGDQLRVRITRATAGTSRWWNEISDSEQGCLPQETETTRNGGDGATRRRHDQEAQAVDTDHCRWY
jgi:hypothetical protein